MDGAVLFLFTAATNNDDNVNDSAKFSCEFLIGARNANESIRHGLFPLQTSSTPLAKKKMHVTAASAETNMTHYHFCLPQQKYVMTHQ